MPAITETHKAANGAMARYWLQRNGFQSVNGRWMDSNNRWARCEPMPSGKVMIYVGGGMSEVKINGVTYEMVESQGCKGCAFRSGGKCAAPLSAPRCYHDGFTSMIFVKKEMACHGDDEWDAKYEIFERHYPLIKWAVVAGLLGLVWLVSL